MEVATITHLNRAVRVQGWQVDHREALICGGRDELDNLQWLRFEEHKAKTRVEVKLCRPRVYRSSAS